MSYVVGVDLGTTYTAAAVLRRDDQPQADPGRDDRERDGRVEVVELGDRVASVASVLWFRDDHGLVVGEAAVRRAESDPGRVAREFKRRFGDPVPIMVAGTPISADALTARLLRWVVDVVTEQEGGEPAVVGVTHPANWGPYKLDLLAQAVRLAGVSHARFVSEPHAAAESHATATRVPAGDVVAVYDLGGGTFDAAVLRRNDSGFELLGADGIERLGGIDFDEAVFGHVREVIGPGLTALDQADPVVAQASARLRDDCARAKEALSSDTEVSIPVALPGLHTMVRLCRGEFEEMIRPIVASTIDTLSRAITSAGLTPAQVSKVLLVGGSSRIPLVSLMIGTELGCPVALDTHPKHAVARGSAYLAGRESSAATADRTGAGAVADAEAAGTGAMTGVDADAAARSEEPEAGFPTGASSASWAGVGTGRRAGQESRAGVRRAGVDTVPRVGRGSRAGAGLGPRAGAPAAADAAPVSSPKPPPLTPPPPTPPRAAEVTKVAQTWAAPEEGVPALSSPLPPSGPAAQRRPARRKRVAVAVLLVMAVAALAMSLVNWFNSAEAEVFLEPADSPGSDVFTADVADPDNPTVPPPDLGQRDGQVLGISGDHEALYGGTNNRRICNKDQLVDFLVHDEAKGSVWAETLGIRSTEIPGYVDGLTPGLLQMDTRVTNHGYRDGKQTARQAVLQAGTAVLVDSYGMPRVKCACGNPLTDAVNVSEPNFVGSNWPGFDSASLARVVPAERPMERFVLRDVHSGKASARPVGTEGERDVKSPEVLPVPGGGSVPSAGSGSGTTGQPESTGSGNPADTGPESTKKNTPGDTGSNPGSTSNPAGAGGPQSTVSNSPKSPGSESPADTGSGSPEGTTSPGNIGSGSPEGTEGGSPTGTGSSTDTGGGQPGNTGTGNPGDTGSVVPEGTGNPEDTGSGSPEDTGSTGSTEDTGSGSPEGTSSTEDTEWGNPGNTESGSPGDTGSGTPEGTGSGTPEGTGSGSSEGTDNVGDTGSPESTGNVDDAGGSAGTGYAESTGSR